MLIALTQGFKTVAHKTMEDVTVWFTLPPETIISVTFYVHNLVNTMNDFLERLSEDVLCFHPF